MHTLLASYTSGLHMLAGYTLSACIVGRLHFCYMNVDKSEICSHNLDIPIFMNLGNASNLLTSSNLDNSL